MILKARPAASVALAFVLAGMFVASPAHASDLPDGKPITVPFTIDHGHIVISVEVNGKPASFVLDSGAGADVVSSAAAEGLGIDKDHSAAPALMLGTGGRAATYPANLDSLKVGGVTLTKSPVFLVEMPRLFKEAGLLGYEFLRRFVTTIDYQALTVTFRDTATPQPGDIVIPFVLSGNVPGVDGGIDGKKGRLQIDTGDGGSIDVNTPFTDHNHLRKNYKKRFETVTGLGVGGDVRGTVVRLGTLMLGTAAVQNPIAHLSLQKDGAFATSDVAATVGYDILSRYKLTLDYPGSRLILTDAGLQDKPFDYNRSGLGFSVMSSRPKVVDILAGSPGALAGAAIGDEVIEVNGAPLAENDFLSLSDAVRAAPGAVVRLKLRSPHQETREITFTLRELL